MANLPITTVVPFTALPSCATLCGPLYDANGACVPPAAATADANTYDTCFCQYGKLQPFLSTTAGVCDAACTADSGGLSTIQSWFTSFCSGRTTGATTTGTTTASAASSTSSLGSSNSGGGDWMSTHWKWVVMIIIVIVGIVGIWMGACIWRRKYLKKKDRMYELGKGLPSTVAVNTQGRLVGPGAPNNSEPGSFMAGAGSEKPKDRKRWNVGGRT